jgi:hypothetical protein
VNVCEACAASQRRCELAVPLDPAALRPREVTVTLPPRGREMSVVEYDRAMDELLSSRPPHAANPFGFRGKDVSEQEMSVAAGLQGVVSALVRDDGYKGRLTKSSGRCRLGGISVPDVWRVSQAC